MVGGGGRKILTLGGATADILGLNLDNRAGVLGPGAVRTATTTKIG